MKMKMKMDCLPLHLFFSHYASTLLFLVFTIFISCFVPSSRACRSEPFQCGNQTFEYPFGGKKSGCGDPALQLECDHKENMSIITIGGYQYYILNISEAWEDGGPITIIDKNQWRVQRRNPSLFSNYTSEIWSSLQFRIAEEYKIVTLWEGCSPEAMKDSPLASPLPCNNSWYFNLTEDLSTFGKLCKSQVTIPVPAESWKDLKPDLLDYPGLRIYWGLSEGCKHFESEKNLCTYNVTNSAQLSCKSPSTKPSRPIILGSAIGSGALVVMGALVLFVNRKRCLSTSSVKPDISNVEKFLRDYVHQMPCRYSYSQIMKITNKFAHKVGEGGFGVVYKGKLSTGESVAVKMLDHSRQCENQFMNEIATIGRIHHVHLVRLMGYCYEEHRNALVYEYMDNGSLDNFEKVSCQFCFDGCIAVF